MDMHKFNAYAIPNRNVLRYGKYLQANHPILWRKSGSAFPDYLFKRLLRVCARGYWLDREYPIFLKWKAYTQTHRHDENLSNVVALVKCGSTLHQGLPQMRKIIHSVITQQYGSTNKSRSRISRPS